MIPLELNELFQISFGMLQVKFLIFPDIWFLLLKWKTYIKKLNLRSNTDSFCSKYLPPTKRHRLCPTGPDDWTVCFQGRYGTFQTSFFAAQNNPFETPQKVAKLWEELLPNRINFATIRVLFAELVFYCQFEPTPPPRRQQFYCAKQGA